MKRYFLLLLLPLLTFAEPAYIPLPVHEHYSNFLKAYRKNRYKQALNEGNYIQRFHASSPFTRECTFYLGEAYYKLGKYSIAKQHFSTYLSSGEALKHYREALDYNMSIAKIYIEKACKPPFNENYFAKADQIYSEVLTTIVSMDYFTEAMHGKFEIANVFANKGYSGVFFSEKYFDHAQKIYNEIITSMPRNQLTADALYRKAKILAFQNEYKDSIETYDLEIHRFPKHEATPKSFLGIAEVYHQQIMQKFPDEELIHRAEINLDRFRDAFPTEPRIGQAEGLLYKMQERFAKELYEIGCFYEKTKKVDAAKVYYQTVIAQYPLTESANRSAKRMEKIAKHEANNISPTTT